MSKKYYESGDMFLNVDKRLTKNRCLNIGCLSNDNVFSARIFWSINKPSLLFLNGRQNKRYPTITKDYINNKNVLLLKLCAKNLNKRYEYDFYEENKANILNVLRIARQYAKDNEMSLYISSDMIPETEFADCVLDRKTNTVYPILYDELKIMSEQNLSVVFQPRRYHASSINIFSISFSFPDNLKVEIDLRCNVHDLNISLRDKDGNISYNMSNIKLTNETEYVVIHDDNLSFDDKILKENDDPMNIILLPKYEGNLNIEYQSCSAKPVVFRDTDLKERNVEIKNYTYEICFIDFLVILQKFYNKPEKLTNNEKNTLRESFIFMKENNFDIIEQSKILLNYMMNGKNLMVDDIIYEDKKKVEKNIKLIIENDDKCKKMFYIIKHTI